MSGADAIDEDWPEPVEWYNRYWVGVTEYHPGPDSREVRYMYFLVAYDICSDKRLRQVAKLCESYGFRVEKSVFECDLPYERFQELWLGLMDIIDEEEDAVVAYRLCSSCLKEVESMGVVPRPQKGLCYIL